MSSLNWIWLATMVFSSSWVFMGSSVFECSPPSTMVMESSDFLWLGLSCRSNTWFWCCSNGMSPMFTSFNTVMGLELELLAWMSVLGFSLESSLWSWPSSPLRKGLVGLNKVRSPSISIYEPNKYTQNAMQFLTWTGQKVGSKLLHCRVSLLFHCFP